MSDRRGKLPNSSDDAEVALNAPEYQPASTAFETGQLGEMGTTVAARMFVRALPVLVVVASALIVFSRRPDAFIHPQFWAEDGKYWFATAYNHGGVAELFQPHTGYLQFLSRSTAMVSMLFPVSWAPGIFVAVAVAVQVAPAAFLVSERCSSLIASRTLRLFLASLYVAIPNSFEVDANLTNAQWHLALLALLVVVAKPPRTAPARVADVGIVALSGLTGPFCILLFPVACVFLALRRRPWTAVLVGAVGVTGLAQLVMLFTSPRGSPGALGASISGFFTIVGRQVFLGAIVGQSGLEHLSHGGDWSAISIAAGAAGIAFALAAGMQVRTEVQIVGLFGALVLAASLASPTSTNPIKDWVGLSLPGVGGRYWLIPMFAFLALAVGVIDQRWDPSRISEWRALHRRAWPRARSDGARLISPWVAATMAGAVLVVLATLAIGIPRDWRYPPFVNYHFARYAAVLARAKPGQAVTIPINPPGWSMTLIKRG